MVPGVSGDLVSGAFLERALSAHPGVEPGFERWARGLLRWWRRASAVLGPASGARVVLDVAARPLVEHLGFSLDQLHGRTWGHSGVLSARGSPAAVLLALGWGRALTAVWPEAVRLGLAASLPWAVATNGETITVIDCTRPWVRRWLTFDLATITRHELGARAAWRCATAEAIVGDRERSRLGQVADASDRHGLDVCVALGGGVLEALGALIGALDPRGRRGASRGGAVSSGTEAPLYGTPGRMATGGVAGRGFSPAPSNGAHPTQTSADAHVFEQALTIVYRLLFLLFAEAHGLVPIWHDVYRDAYTLDTLCRRLQARPDSRGAWATVRAISRLAHTGCRTTDLAVTAFNGRLFAPGRTPLAERRGVADEPVARAVLALATQATRAGRHRIAFHDLGVEQLGSVYERVLEYEPVRVDRVLTLSRTSTERKATGSFYTPQAVSDFVVRRTLAPLVEGRPAEAILRLRVLDPSMGSGAFLVAACRYLARHAEQALISEGAWSESDVTEQDRAGLRRTVAERCLYGVDLNPMAVQLTRLSLWLTTLAADRPLTFLDHHLAVGNSLVGAWLEDLSHKPARVAAGRARPSNQLPLFDEAAAGHFARSVLPDRACLSEHPSDTAIDVRDKERRLEGLTGAEGPLSRWWRAADVWCGLHMDPPPGLTEGLYAELQRAAVGLATTLPSVAVAPLADRAVSAAQHQSAFHWDLAFAEVFLDGSGHPHRESGFDAVIGNPPWDMVRADSGAEANRRAARDAARELVRYVRRSGHYPLQGDGHLNQYQLFLERTLRLLRPGGRLGLILPSGLQADVGSGPLRRALVSTCAIDTWLGFDNRRAIFPIHRSMRFVLLAASKSGSTDRLPLTCGLNDPAHLTRVPDHPRGEDAAAPRVWLSAPLLERADPAHLTIPHLESQRDLAILVRALDLPRLASEVGWGVRFGRELNATEHKRHFLTGVRATGVRTTTVHSTRVQTTGVRTPGVQRTPHPSMEVQRPERGAPGERLPVVEGKHLRPFGVSWEGITQAIDRHVAAGLVEPGSTFERARIAYRDVASATNRLTLIAAVLPAGVVSTHTVLCAKTALSGDDRWCLLGLLNSLVANYLVRLQMSTHVTTALMARLPVPRPARGSRAHGEIAALARGLARTGIDDDPPAYARLNAVVAGLYGLTAQEYARVVETFPLLMTQMGRDGADGEIRR
jgi:hypothetical protein